MKNHHDDDQDDRPQILEDPACEEETGPSGQGIEDAQGQESNQDSKGTGPLNPNIETVENVGDNQDIDDILPADAEERFFQVLNLSPPGRFNHSIIISAPAEIHHLAAGKIVADCPFPLARPRRKK
ncbi:MAG: hypothetical protein HXY45_14585 [Syntrophaceae bacterium]|nr:hypothetical protein [Syntrophaceae bacterium]